MSDLRLRIVYMGTADFAVPALDALFKAGHEIVFVVTQPDRPWGRGGKVRPTPIGAYAEKEGLALLKPERIRDNEEFISEVTAAAPDLIVVAAYGKILPKILLEIPPLGCVNIHASQLPEYRGAAPVQRALLDGVQETGVTLVYMGEGLDSGDIIASSGVNVSDMNAGELTEVLAVHGARILIDSLPFIADGTAPRIPQDESKATYAEKIEKSDGLLDFSGRTAEEIVRRVRAMTPAPGAFVMNEGERIGITEAAVYKPLFPGGVDFGFMVYKASKPGTVCEVIWRGIVVRAAEGVVLIKAIKMPGRKAMPVEEYLKGNRFNIKKL